MVQVEQKKNYTIINDSVRPFGFKFKIQPGAQIPLATHVTHKKLADWTSLKFIKRICHFISFLHVVWNLKSIKRRKRKRFFSVILKLSGCCVMSARDL
jgi:hypothetical protein